MAAEGALRPATIGSVTGLPARTGPPNAPTLGRFIRIHPTEARGLRPGSGRCHRGQCPCWRLPARLGWIARPAVRSPHSGPANCAGNLAARTSRTTVWCSAPARVSRLDAQLRWVALVSKMGSPALYRNPEQADLVFTKCSMGRQYLEQLDSQGGLADASGRRSGLPLVGRRLGRLGRRARSARWRLRLPLSSSHR